jgi:hypothetical protein
MGAKPVDDCPRLQLGNQGSHLPSVCAAMHLVMKHLSVSRQMSGGCVEDKEDKEGSVMGQSSQ